MANVITALPALLSPLIQAAMDAYKEGHEHALKAHLIAAEDQAKLWETVGKGNAEKALELARENSDLARTNSELVRENSDLRGTIDTLQNLINKMRQDIAAMQKEANNEEYHY